MNRDEGNALGLAGERRAAWFYRLRGFRVLARNVTFRDGELDLVVRRGRLVVFVEVKTRGEGHLGEPAASVDRPKQLRIMKCADVFLARHRLGQVDIRFDIVAVVRTRWRFRIEHIPNAFEARFENTRPWKRV